MPGLEDLYREIILDHYRNPRNRGELETPPAHKTEGFNPLCGDEIVVYLDLDGTTVRDIKIAGQGCSISQSSASMMSAAVKGKTLDEVRDLTRAFKAMMSIHESSLEGEAGGDELDDVPDVKLGDLEADPSGGDPMARFQELMGDPEVVLGAVRTPRQDEILPWLEALVTVVVGYVDHIMDEVGHGLVGGYDRITEAMRRRRVEAAASDRFVERLLGLDLTQDHFDRGRAFVDGVVERAGAAGLERLWSSAEVLPTPNEVSAPGLWLARIEFG